MSRAPNVDLPALLPQKGHQARGLAVVLLVLGPLAIGILAVFLGQDANWDLRNYHWYNAYAFLNDRYGMDLLASQTPYFYNPLLDLPFYLLATHLPAKLTAFLLGFVQGLNFILLFMLAYGSLVIPNPRQKVLGCAALAMLGMLGGGGIALIGTTFYDNVTSLGVFLSALLVLRNLKSLFALTPGKAFLLALLCGLPAGLMMGLKLPCVIFCVGLCFAMLCVSGAWQRRLLVSFAFGIGILLGLAVTFGHWGWFLQTHFGSPLFPYFNDFFKSPLAPLSSARDTQYVTRSFHDFILFPFIFTQSPFRAGEIPWRDLRIPILYALLPLAILLRLFFGRARNNPQAIAEPQAARYLLWVAVLSYFAWLGMFCIYRYAVPLEMLAPLLIVMTVGMLPFRIQTKKLTIAFILIVIAVTIQPGNWHRRKEWNDGYVTITRPELGPVSDTMLLMGGFEPYSHIVTQFPPEMPIVRIQSNFASPDQGKGINKLLTERLDSHQGRFLLLIPSYQKKMAQEALGFFQLALGSQDCEKVVDRLFDDSEMDLCPVERIK